MTRRQLVAALLVVLAACLNGTSPVTSPTSAPLRPSNEGPFIDSDPNGVILDTYWVDPKGQTTALDRPIPETEPGAVLMDSSKTDRLRIAVNGNGCVPETYLAILEGPPRLELQITLTEAIPEPGIECSDLLTTHAFEVLLAEPVALEDVRLSVTP